MVILPSHAVGRVELMRHDLPLRQAQGEVCCMRRHLTHPQPDSSYGKPLSGT